jgi:tetratricopeptide (TPR) repeat protein
LNCKPGNAQAAGLHVLMGKALEKQDKLGDAQKEYAAAVQLNPELEQAHLSLGAALARQKKYGEATAEYKAALKINPASVAAQASLAKLNPAGTDAQSVVH